MATARSGFEAKVIAARLGSDGIVCELRGGVDSVYPIGIVQILVSEVDADVARALLLADDVESAFDDDPDDMAVPAGLDLWFVALALAAAVLFAALRILSLI